MDLKKIKQSIINRRSEIIMNYEELMQKLKKYQKTHTHHIQNFLWEPVY